MFLQFKKSGIEFKLAIILFIGCILPQIITFENSSVFYIFLFFVLLFSLKQDVDSSKLSLWHVVAILFFGLYIYTSIQTLYLLGAYAILFFICNLYQYSITRQSVLIAVLSLPATKFILSSVSFEWRLITTKIVGSILKHLDIATKIDGNIVEYKGVKFGVDEPCAGIDTMQIGFIISAITLSYFQKKYEIRITNSKFTIFFILNIVLILFANLQRITITILFHIKEGTTLHEIIGLLFICCFVAVPNYFILKYYYKHKIIAFPHTIQPLYIHFKKLYNVYLILICMSFFSIYTHHKKTNQIVEINNHIGYQTKQCKYGVTQYTKGNSLVYIKPPVPFYASSHKPQLCWKGNGYNLEQEKIELINNHSIKTGLLKNKQGQFFYTAYWFQSKKNIVCQELNWRWLSLKENQKFELRNTTSTTKELLQKQIIEVMSW